MKTLKPITFLVLLLFALNACQVDNELQQQEEMSSELEKSASERSERVKGNSRDCKTIILTSSWMTVDYDQYHMIINRIIENGFTFQGNPDCQDVYTWISSDWENEVIASVKTTGTVDDTVTFRLKDLRIACFDCQPPSSPIPPHALCSYTGQYLKVTSGNQCILGTFLLTEASVDNVTVDLISMLSPQYCEVCYISNDELEGL